jgi:hypothetical protein
MPTLPPETYTFQCFVNSSVEPPVIMAYWNSGLPPNQTEADALITHGEQGHVDFSMSITRTVSENRVKLPVYDWQFKAHADAPEKAAAINALEHLQELYPSQIKQFFLECWKTAQGNFTQMFPKVFPRQGTNL